MRSAAASLPRRARHARRRRRTATVPAHGFAAVVIGTSTGGPEALRVVIPALPPDMTVPVFVVQHVPPMFSATLASRLNEMSAVSVVEATDGTAGCAAVKAHGGQVIAQAREGCTIWGMPKSVQDRGLCDAVEPLPRIAAAIHERLASGPPRAPGRT